MTPTAAAKEWLEADAIYKAAKKRREAAEAVLKPHFREKKLTVFRGVAYAAVHGTRFDPAKAKDLLGPKKAQQCEVPSLRETLSAVPK